MKELTVKQYAKKFNLKENTVYWRIKAVEKLKKQLADLETESFGSCSLKNELKMVKLKHKINRAIKFEKFKGSVTIFVD